MGAKSYTPSFSSENMKVEQTTIDNYVEDDVTSNTNEFGHGSGTFLTGFFSVTCVVAGTGTLGLPHALALGGWLGLFIMMLSYAMAMYSGIILIRCLYYKPGERLHDYKAVGTAAFGWAGYTVSSFLHWLNIFGCPALYLVLASANITHLLRDTNAALNTTNWTIIIGAILLIPSLLAKTLKEMTSISALGAICTMMAVLVITIEAPIFRKNNPGLIVETDPVIWTGFPSSLATIAFSYGGNNTYPHVEHAMKKPHQWKWACIAGLSCCTCLYLLTAVPGYWAFGRGTVSPIYNDLPEGAGKLVAMIVMTIHVILAIPIYTITFSLEFERFLKVSDESVGKFKAWIIRAIIRTICMGILVVLAIFVPYFDNFMALIGALSNCGLVFLLPVLCYIKLTGFRNKPWYELCFCALTLLLGVVGCVFGTIDAVKALVRDFESGR
ncbi:hypothetical protein MFLAVUS_007238 [Mucor flavus]|uniref:Amino acid transporter transmembrane domain-containing protein n=1 Tax=Mucor flavus TaxID=439312 RepID=A0ABP9Z3U7_9FUNG